MNEKCGKNEEEELFCQKKVFMVERLYKFSRATCYRDYLPLYLFLLRGAFSMVMVMFKQLTIFFVTKTADFFGHCHLDKTVEEAFLPDDVSFLPTELCKLRVCYS